jgi:hypothetical protein
MKEFTPEMILAKKTISDLRAEARERKLPNFWKLRRAQLVELLYPEKTEVVEDKIDAVKN